ncbi:titin-like [Camellia sinensis]|uniref:titin-like n=1 Tax=Camellia sinensis TaxID=4442 RepID=UPI001035B3C3|nr:titin-like [Camellia sinensis]
MTSVLFAAVRQPPKNFRQSFVPSNDLKKLPDLPIEKRKAPLLLNFIPTYRSALPDILRKKKKKGSSSPSATTLPVASSSRTDQGSTSDPAEQPSTSVPYLVPPSQRKRRRRLVFASEMGRTKPITKDLIADIPLSIDKQTTQIQPPEKPKRIKKAQPKAKVAQVETKDTLPAPQLAPSQRTASVPLKRSAEVPHSESSKSKKPRSSATTSGSKKPAVLWTPEITLEDKPVMASDSADDINVGVALSTALLLPGDLERNAKYSEYENYALMLQHSVQKLEDQAEAAIKAQNNAEEKAEAAEAIRKVAESQRREAEEKMAQAEKELQEADAIPLPFPPAPTPSEDIGESDAEDEAEEEDDDALIRKSKGADGDDEGDLVPKEAVPEIAPADIPSEVKTVEETLQEIDAEIAAEKEAEVVSDLQPTVGEES